MTKLDELGLRYLRIWLELMRSERADHRDCLHCGFLDAQLSHIEKEIKELSDV